MVLILMNIILFHLTNIAGILNPWTGEPIHLSEDQDENSAPDGKSPTYKYLFFF